MNVNEQILNDKIDPFLTADRLSAVGTQALGHAVQANEARILTGGCWNRVISVSFLGDEPELVYKINPAEHHEGIVREYKVLEFFAGTDLPVPTPYHLDADGGNIPGTLLVMKKMPGLVMHHCYGRLSPNRSETGLPRNRRPSGPTSSQPINGFWRRRAPPREATQRVGRLLAPPIRHGLRGYRFQRPDLRGASDPNRGGAAKFP